MGWMPTSRTTHSFKLGTHPLNTLHYQDRGYARSCNPYTSENYTSTRLGEYKRDPLGERSIVVPGVLLAQRRTDRFHRVGDARPCVGECPGQREFGLATAPGLETALGGFP